jgi:hypothetical protein
LLARLPRTIWRNQGDDTMNRRNMLSLTAAGLIGLCATGIAVAQEKQRVSYKVPAENVKYTQSVSLIVQDEPNHILRAYELHTTFPNNAPVFSGLKLVETREQGIGDRFDGSGDGRSYTVFTMENGDKFFVRTSFTVQNRSGKTSATTSGQITGGTGKFAGMKGALLSSNTFDIKTGSNEPQVDIEYWMGK